MEGTTLADRTRNAGGWFGRKAVRHAGEIAAFLPSWGGALRSATFLAIRDYVICIDDVERKGAGLAMTDVLGLVSLLKEQRNCKIVLILNEEAFSQSHHEKETYSGFREKVLDREITFSPSADECQHIAFSGKENAHTIAGVHARRFDITNIRILNRVARIIDDFLPHLRSARPSVLESFVHAATVVTWCYYGEAADAPPYQFVRRLSLGQLMSVGDDKRTEDEKKWASQLTSFASRDQTVLDPFVYMYLENGYVSTDLLASFLDDANEQADALAATTSLETAWGLFYNTFAENTEVAMATLASSAASSARWVHFYDAESVTVLLRKLGSDAQADAFIEHWVNVNAAIDPGRLMAPHEFGIDVRDQQFHDAATTAVLASRKTPSLSDTIKYMAPKNGWDDIDIQVLAAASTADYVNFFRNAGPDPALSRYIRRCLEIGRHGGEPFSTIGLTVSEALRQLADESPINAYRVSLFQLQAPAPNPQPTS